MYKHRTQKCRAGAAARLGEGGGSLNSVIISAVTVGIIAIEYTRPICNTSPNATWCFVWPRESSRTSTNGEINLRRNLLKKGDGLIVGAEVPEGGGTYIYNGIVLAFIGAKVYRYACKTVGLITVQGSR